MVAVFEMFKIYFFFSEKTRVLVLMHLPAVQNIQAITLGLVLKTPKQSVLFMRPFQCLLVLMGCRTVVCWEKRSFKSLYFPGGLDVLSDTKQKYYLLSFIQRKGLGFRVSFNMFLSLFLITGV